MSVASGPNKVTSGLVFDMDMANSQKSWRGQPTTNLFTNPDMSSGASGYSSYVSSTPVAVIATDVPTSIDRPRNVLQITSAAAAGGGGNSGGLAMGCPSTTAGVTYTMSYYARSINNSSLNITWSCQNGSGDQNNLSHGNTIGTTWARYTRTVTLDIAKSTFYHWSGSNNAVWQIADLQLEANSFATPFVNGSRSNTQALLDLTGQNTITTTSLTYASNNTFSFNGTSNYITVPNSANLNPGNGSFSIVCWVNSDPSNAGDAWDLWIAKRAGGGSVGYYVGANSPLGVRFMLGNDAGSRTDTGFIGYTFNTWAMFTAILDRTANTQTIIRNNYDESASTTPSGGNYTNVYDLNIGGDVGVNVPAGQFYTNGSIAQVMMYNRALSAIEVGQIFNALRGRYGI